jgi:hypothetical protein
MRVLGVKSVKVTNVRGFCLEISTAIVVVVASRFGAALPRGKDDLHAILLNDGQMREYLHETSHSRCLRKLHAGLPVSTTQVLCGAVMGIGLFEGKNGVNWRQAAKVGLPQVTSLQHCILSIIALHLPLRLLHSRPEFDCWGVIYRLRLAGWRR